MAPKTYSCNKQKRASSFLTAAPSAEGNRVTFVCHRSNPCAPRKREGNSKRFKLLLRHVTCPADTNESTPSLSSVDLFSEICTPLHIPSVTMQALKLVLDCFSSFCHEDTINCELKSKTMHDRNNFQLEDASFCKLYGRMVHCWGKEGTLQLTTPFYRLILQLSSASVLPRKGRLKTPSEAVC